jgi:hypothetical protein
MIGHQPFGVQVRVNESVTGLTLQDVVDKLKQGDPPVWTRARDGDDYIALHIFGLSEGEEEIVGNRIAALFD